MDRPIPDKPAEPHGGGQWTDGQRSWGYILTACVLWALIAYSLSPFSLALPIHSPAKTVHACR